MFDVDLPAGLVDPDTKAKTAASVCFLEGPAWHASGDLYFSDIAGSRILKLAPDGAVSVFRADSGRTNGNTFDAQGRLVSCEGAEFQGAQPARNHRRPNRRPRHLAPGKTAGPHSDSRRRAHQPHLCRPPNEDALRHRRQDPVSHRDHRQRLLALPAARLIGSRGRLWYARGGSLVPTEADRFAMRVFAVDRPDLAPLEMPPRFKHDIAYFMTPSGEHGAPTLPAGQYWVRLEDARRWLDEGVLSLVSPLDSEHQAEAEITEEQEAWLEWMIANNVERVRLET